MEKFKLISLIIILLLFVSFGYSQTFYTANGERFSMIMGKTQKNKIVIDDLTLNNGFGTVHLNKENSKVKTDVTGSSVGNMFVFVIPRLADTSTTVNYYGTVLFADSVIVKSSNASDNSTVSVLIILR